MSKHFNRILPVALTAALTLAAFASQASQEGATKLLTAQFEPRQVVQVEIGDFHFKPGQPAPIHTHAAPAVGYVAKGTIIYQVEGERPQILRQGDAFYEPAGPRILRFDNASATQEAIFLDFNLEQTNEPFIVFEEQPTEDIDRRTLPTIDLGGETVEQVDIFANELQPGGSIDLESSDPALGLVAQGVIEFQIQDGPVQRIAAGGSFSLPADQTAVFANASSEVPATVITFELR